jgi:hypothetical protein
MPPGYNVRLRTALEKKKSLTQYEELRRSGRIIRAVVIVEMNDGSYQVLGQGMSTGEIAQSLAVAGSALDYAAQQGRQARLEPHQEPETRGVHNGSKPRKREITLSPSGMMTPPPGENIISCSECAHPRWYVLHHTADDTPARYACAACGNEIVSIQLFHREGRA